jgi:hypothetical protein
MWLGLPSLVKLEQPVHRVNLGPERFAQLREATRDPIRVEPRGGAREAELQLERQRADPGRSALV